MEVVGVAKDERHLTYNLDKPIGPFFFVPEAQYTTFTNAADTKSELFSHCLHDIVIATGSDAVGGLGAQSDCLGRSESACDFRPKSEGTGGRPIQPAASDCTVDFAIRSPVARTGSIGIYGVTAHNASQRVGEIGVRIALGANRRDVVTLILRGAFALVLCGLALGLPFGFAVGRFLGSQLYGNEPLQPRVDIRFAIGARIVIVD